MRCPRCDTGTFNERHRNDLQVHVCERCRGVWLDRGDLEKLIAYAQLEVDLYERFRQEFERAYKPVQRHAAADIRHEERSHGKHDKRDKKKALLDIFKIFD